MKLQHFKVDKNKIAEVFREEGPINFLKTAVRVLHGQARLWYLRRIRKRPEVTTRIGQHKMITRVYDPGIGCELVLRGQHEKISTREIQRRLRPGMHVIDLGANIGYYPLIEAAKVGPEGKVYAVEPAPDNFDLLQRNISLNGYKNVVPCQVAIGGESGIATMYVSSYSTRHSFSSKPTDMVGEIDVPILTFEDFLVLHEIDLDKVGLIRMDIEGYEAKVIPSMVRALSRCKHPVQLYIEFHPQKIARMPGCSFDDCLKELKSVNAHFDLFLTRNERGKIVVRDVEIDRVRKSNLIISESWLTVNPSGTRVEQYAEQN